MDRSIAAKLYSMFSEGPRFFFGVAAFRNHQGCLPAAVPDSIEFGGFDE